MGIQKIKESSILQLLMTYRPKNDSMAGADRSKQASDCSTGKFKLFNEKIK
jgi:hypothetical protein